MRDDAKDIGVWLESANCFEVMGLFRRMGLLTSEDLKKAMRLSRDEWIEMMREKAGLAPETKSKSW